MTRMMDASRNTRVASSSGLAQKSAPLPCISPLHLNPVNTSPQVDLKRDQNETDRLLMTSLSFLLKNDNYLTRCLLQVCLSEDDLDDKIVGYLIDLHGSPLSLFLSCLTAELNRVKDLSLLARERSESVCVLQTFWAPLVPHFEHLCEPLSKLGEHLSKKDVGFMLGTEDPTEKALVVKDKIVSTVKNILRPNALPSTATVLCYRAIKLLEESSVAVTGQQSPANWVVGALLFLRFLVPIVMSKRSSGKSEGKTFLAKFLMKMSSGSTFGASELGLADVALEELRPSFDRFCKGIKELGQVHQKTYAPPVEVARRSSPRKAELSEYLSNRQRVVSKIFAEAGLAPSEQFEWMDMLRQLISALKGRNQRKEKSKSPLIPRLAVDTVGYPPPSISERSPGKAEGEFVSSFPSYPSAPSRLKTLAESSGMA